jgi:hypothetical protein
MTQKTRSGAKTWTTNRSNRRRAHLVGQNGNLSPHYASLILGSHEWRRRRKNGWLARQQQQRQSKKKEAHKVIVMLATESVAPHLVGNNNGKRKQDCQEHQSSINQEETGSGGNP